MTPKPRFDLRQWVLFGYHLFLGIAATALSLVPLSKTNPSDFELLRGLAGILGTFYLVWTGICMLITRYLVRDIRIRNLIAMWGPPVPFFIGFLIWGISS